MSTIESPSVPPPRKRLRKVRWMLLAFMLIALPCGWIAIRSVVTGGHPFEVQFVFAEYAGGVEFIGIRKDDGSPITYFSVRVKDGNDRPIKSECPLVLHWQGRSFPVHSITPEILRGMGVVVEQPDYKGPEWEFGFLGGGDQNRDFGIEFHLREGRIVEFYARHNSSALCLFQLSGGDQPPVAFPLSEDQLEKTFGQPRAVTWFWGH